MKVAILTFRWANNYGAVLQAYALLRTVRQLVQHVEFLNYVAPLQRWDWLRNWGVRSGTIARMLPLRLAFMHFRRKHLPATARVSSSTALARLVSHYDACIVGSDQVWNGRIHGGYDPAFFLDFIPHGGPKAISYAACFGQPDQPESHRSQLQNWLQRFSAISVRNEFSRKLVQQLAGRNAEVVLDPTLLWNFDDLLKPVTAKPKGYILVYALSDDHRESMGTVVRAVAQRTGLPVISVWPTVPFEGPPVNRLAPGPIGWLRLFRNARFICTDSFHGCGVAVKFTKQLLCWPGARPQRLIDFLAMCGLENRLLEHPTGPNVEDALRRDIDYALVHARLQERVASSLDFLKRSIAS